ncbi:hypothetical protein PENSPDRAFT_282143 [Peniophora sp. CONT]|nr:hypothetical protein PENSPDRAFT_282143 [Peniophora sp. CONT]
MDGDGVYYALLNAMPGAWFACWLFRCLRPTKMRRFTTVSAMIAQERGTVYRVHGLL